MKKEFKMRKILALMIALMITSSAFAQMETVFSGRLENGGYGGAIVKIGDLDGETAVWVGGKGGWIINHSFVIGGGGYGLVTENKEFYYITYGEHRKLVVGYGGLILEYINNPFKIVHISGGVLIGGGGAGYAYRYDYYDDWNSNNTDAFFAMEPNLGLELNIATYVRAELGISYLYTSGIELPDTDDEDVSGPTGYLALKFGAF
jgi:hypothetical protein